MSMGTPLFYFKIKVTNDKIISGQSLNKNLLSLLFQRNYLKTRVFLFNRTGSGKSLGGGEGNESVFFFSVPLPSREKDF